LFHYLLPLFSVDVQFIKTFNAAPTKTANKTSHAIKLKKKTHRTVRGRSTNEVKGNYGNEKKKLNEVVKKPCTKKNHYSHIIVLKVMNGIYQINGVLYGFIKRMRKRKKTFSTLFTSFSFKVEYKVVILFHEIVDKRQ
jgi:hypothetical protein